MPVSPIQRIAIIGFGEAGGIFGRDLAKLGIEVSAFDTLLVSKRHRRHMLSKARECGVRVAANLYDCVRDSQLVISAVTAASALDVAKEAGAILRAGQTFLDINSVSPETKRKAARLIEPGAAKRSKAHFVEAAVMAAVPGARLKVPMLLGGPKAAETAEQLTSLGMNATAFSNQIGLASAVKMCRSVVLKGIEALAVECLFAARHYGVEDAVLESLAATYPSIGWKDRLPDYLISRVAEHGRRRAHEMREVAQALRSVGIKPAMAMATADRQEHLVCEMAERSLCFESNKSFSWRSLADAIARGGQRRSK
jgi:3-hydroxyisobutyrate dehydrogenase-like beta-hydroxyacid dehydrogenase